VIDYKKFTLSNGLRLIVHEDDSTPMATVNILYDVGARDETPEKTGFAHLFEHLMFGGSVNIPDFDGPLQQAGGNSNAFTSSDITNYYDVLPAHNLETALWLESDRMLNLDFSQRSLDVQKKVVSEEFKQHYLNQPYGDVWHNVLKLSYKNHPYSWPVIGKNLQHIDNFELSDVKNFFYKHYRPNNAIMTIAGGVKAEAALALVEKWFGDIPAGETYDRKINQEPKQTEQSRQVLKADVPQDAIYITFKMPERLDKDYYASDFLSDILSGSSSSRLYQSLVKEKELFSNMDAYLTSWLDPGLLLLEGKLQKGVEMESAENAIWEVLDEIKTTTVEEEEMVKVKHKIESTIEFSQNKLLNRAMDLSYFELVNQIELINDEVKAYQKVSAAEVKNIANTFLKPEQASILHYFSKNN